MPPAKPVIVGDGFGSLAQKEPDAYENAALSAGLTVIVIVVVVAHCPAVGVKV